MEALGLAVLAVAVVSGAVSGSIASDKGRSGVGYFVLGFLFPLIGILAAGFAVPKDQGHSNPQPSSVRRSGQWAQTQGQKQLKESVATLAILRPPGDPKTKAFLEYNNIEVEAALSACEAGDRVVAFGRGEWDTSRVAFLLIDRGLILSSVVPLGDRRTAVSLDLSDAILIDDLDVFDLDEHGTVFTFAQGDLILDRTSPFTSSEIEQLIGLRQEPEQFVEMAGPGEVVGASKRVRPAASPESDKSLDNVIGELERLDGLRRRGAIDDDEFAELKRKLVWGDGGSTESSG